MKTNGAAIHALLTDELEGGALKKEIQLLLLQKMNHVGKGHCKQRVDKKYTSAKWVRVPLVAKTSNIRYTSTKS